MKFTVAGVTVSLHGDPSLSRSLVSLKYLMDALRNEGEGVLVKLSALEVPEEELVPSILSLLRSLIQQHQRVFTWLGTLPPNRSRDHAIFLHLDASSVSIRPYRYPHIQKDEIEKLVRDMLAASTIRPCSGPFSSLVLLVKKKDWSWCLCGLLRPQ